MHNKIYGNYVQLKINFTLSLNGKRSNTRGLLANGDILA